MDSIMTALPSPEIESNGGIEMDKKQANELLTEIAHYLTEQFICDPSELPPDECRTEAKWILSKCHQSETARIKELENTILEMATEIDGLKIERDEFASQVDGLKARIKEIIAKCRQSEEEKCDRCKTELSENVWSVKFHDEERIKALEVDIFDLKKLMAQDKIRIGEYYGSKLSKAGMEFDRLKSQKDTISAKQEVATRADERRKIGDWLEKHYTVKSPSKIEFTLTRIELFKLQKGEF